MKYYLPHKERLLSPLNENPTLLAFKSSLKSSITGTPLLLCIGIRTVRIIWPRINMSLFEWDVGIGTGRRTEEVERGMLISRWWKLERFFVVAGSIWAMPGPWRTIPGALGAVSRSRRAAGTKLNCVRA